MRCLAVISLVLGLSACHVQGGIVHRVEGGESLLQISHAYEVPVEEILYANSIQNPDKLQPGEKILIPGVRGRRRPVQKFVWEKMVPPTTLTAEKMASKDKYSEKSRKPEIQSSPKAGKLQFIWPAKGRLLVPFGMQGKRMHNGIDLSLSPDEAIRASMSGTVVYKGDQVDGYGNMLILRHPDNLFSVYAYLGRFKVDKGSTVQQGEIIAYASNRKNFAFVHFEIRRGKYAVDPMTFLPKK